MSDSKLRICTYCHRETWCGVIEQESPLFYVVFLPIFYCDMHKEQCDKIAQQRMEKATLDMVKMRLAGAIT